MWKGNRIRDKFGERATERETEAETSERSHRGRGKQCNASQWRKEEGSGGTG